MDFKPEIDPAPQLIFYPHVGSLECLLIEMRVDMKALRAKI
jgi:hypothetical protein